MLIRRYTCVKPFSQKGEPVSSIQGRNINHPQHNEPLKEEKYNLVRAAILAVLPPAENNAGIPFTELEAGVAAYLQQQNVPEELFPKPGSVRWYTKAVQLDLEAREIIERVPGKRPLHLRKRP
jgi:hypothetical protein